MKNIQEVVINIFRGVGRWQVSLLAIFMVFIVTVVRGMVVGNTEHYFFMIFVAAYVILATVLGMVCLRNWRRAGFLLSHLGLLVVIVYGAIGSREIKRMKMTVSSEEVQSWASDYNHPEHYSQPGFSILLNGFSVSMHSSDITLFSQNGKENLRTVVTVNRPVEVDGWKIYQMGYEEKGYGEYEKSCGDVFSKNYFSKLQLVYDPWQPCALLGILMLFLGALWLLVTTLFKARKELRGSYLYVFYSLAIILFFAVCLFYPPLRRKQLIPVLLSPWFAPHIALYIYCYTILTTATIMAVVQFFFRDMKRREVWQKMIDLLVGVGISVMTVGMLIGAIWAKDAWGSYWSWDVKETWAAATWLLYIFFLHARRRGKGVAYPWVAVLLVLALFCLQICWWGVNYLPVAQGSLHVYDV